MLKYALWQDRKKVTSKSPEWLHTMTQALDICSIRSGIDDEQEIQALVALKTKRFEELTTYCRKREFKHSVAYLENAKNDLFTSLSNRLQGKTTSRSRTPLPDGQHEGQCQQVDLFRSLECHKGHAGLLLQRV